MIAPQLLASAAEGGGEVWRLEQKSTREKRARSRRAVWYFWTLVLLDLFSKRLLFVLTNMRLVVSALTVDEVLIYAFVPSAMHPPLPVSSS